MDSFATLKVYEHESPWLLFFLIRAADLSSASILIGQNYFRANQKASERARHDKVQEALAFFVNSACQTTLPFRSD